MQKRKYTHLKAVERLILSMRQDGLTLQEIANELGLSLKQMTNWSYRHNCENRNMLKGIAPKQYILDLRLESAKQLLSNTLLSVAEVGEACGFPNPYHFSRTFKSATGLTPSVYRRNNKIEMV